MAERNVIDVDEDLVLALLTPHPVTGVTRVDQDARTANLFQAMPQRCRLRAGSCADGLGMPSRVRPSALAYVHRLGRFSSYNVTWRTGG